MARPRGGPGRSKGSKSKPARSGWVKAYAANPRARTPDFVSRSADPPKPRKPPGKSFVDARGRWRDSRGHFISRATLFRGFFPGSFEDVGIYLQELAELIRQPVGADRARRYIVAARFLGLPEDRDWRSLSNAHGLKAAIHQAGGRLRFDKKFNRYSLKSEGQQGPLVVYELALHEIPAAKGPSTAPKAKPKAKKKGKKP